MRSTKFRRIVLLVLAVLAGGSRLASGQDAPRPLIPSVQPEMDPAIAIVPVQAQVPAAQVPAAMPLAVEPPQDPCLDCAPEMARRKHLFDALHHSDEYGFKSLFDSIHTQDGPKKKWYEKLNVRGYTQFRYGRTVGNDPLGAEPILLGDRNINGDAENFWIRRARFILFGDVSDYMSIYAQPDFANTPPGSDGVTFFGQLRDLYADAYLDVERVHRFRVGLSKVPFGFENMQSSQNRMPLDRTDPINSAVSPNERDLGVFYYWTPEEKQQLFRDLVDGGLKGTGNFGIFALGIYNGQGGSQLEQNLNLYTVARFTWPFQLPSGQVVEMSLQGYTGEFAVLGAPIRPFGVGPEIVPRGTRDEGDHTGHTDQRIGGTFVWYPQPFGFQTEWNVGQGPGLNDAQDEVITRPLQGGYAMVMYKFDTERCGNVIPYTRYQYYDGGYRSIANAPYGIHKQWDIGVEWHFRREMELTLEYSIVDGVDLDDLNEFGQSPYQQFDGGVVRLQFQVNY